MENTRKQPRILIYGPSKIGISSYCAQIDHAYFMDVSGTLDHLNVNRDRCTSLDECNDLIAELKAGNHTHKALVIDNLASLESIIINDVMAYETEKRTPGIEFFEEIPWGKGPGMVIEKLQEFLKELDSLSYDMPIIIAAHEIQEERHLAFGLPMTVAKPFMMTKVTKAQSITEEASAVLMRWADCVLYASHQNHVRGQYYGNKKYDTLNAHPQTRCIYTERRPGFEAGNRYNLSYELPFKWEALEKGMQEYFNNSCNKHKMCNTEETSNIEE